jgi:lysophospholipase L1-like esterase
VKKLLGLLGSAGAGGAVATALASSLAPVSPSPPADVTNLVYWFEGQFLTGLSDGDPIVSLTDHHTTANHGTQATGSKRATYKTNIQNGMPCARFASASSQYYGLPSINFSGTGVTALAVINTISATDQNIWEMLDFGTIGWFDLARLSDTSMSMGAKGDVGLSTYGSSLALLPVVTDPALVAGMADFSLASGETSLWVNGTKRGVVGSNSNNASGFTSAVSFVGSRAGSSLFLNGDLFALLIFKEALSAARLRAWQRYLGLQYAVAYLPDAADLSENAYSAVGANYIRSSPFARAIITGVDATSVKIEAYSDLFAVQPTNSEIGVRVNGADHATIAMTEAQTIVSQSLPAGANKTVELIAGAQITSGGSILGTFLNSIRFANDNAVLNVRTSNGLLVVYGDSLSQGADAGSLVLTGWTNQVRAAYAGTLRNEGWGSRSLEDDATGAHGGTATVSALAAQLCVGSPTRIWIAIGTNDYGLAAQSAVNFGVDYAALLDAIHVALPACLIYCQSPIQRIAPAGEGNNPFGAGNTLGDYRTQISTAAAARSSYCTYVNGAAAAIVSNANFDTDGIHLVDAGETQYAAFVKTTLGIS